MGDNQDGESAIPKVRGLKRTPLRRHSTGGEAAPELSSFQTPRPVVATQDASAWPRPRVSFSEMTDARDQEDAEGWNATLRTLPLYGVTLSYLDEAVQAWVYERRTVDGTYLCFLANGEAEKLSENELKRRIHEGTSIQLRQGTSHPFVPELLPSLTAYFARYPREYPAGPPYTQWRQMFHFCTQDAWLSIRYRNCQQLRRVALRYLTLVHQRQYEDIWR